MTITIYPPEKQAVGNFDGGKITELKPIGFPGEGSAVKGIGPLFYWAWAHSKKEGHIPMHPHQAFEIITYMVNAKAEHSDTLGTSSIVEAGGLQVMQTGSGVSHSERFIGPDSEGFQIWFEPYIREALQRKPTYNQFDHEAFPVVETTGLTVKTVLGEGSPVELVADVQMWDVELAGGSQYSHKLAAGRSLAALAIRGHGGWTLDTEAAKHAVQFNHKDFTVTAAESGQPEDVVLAASEDGLRMILIEVPTEVDYPLYKKNR
ncbi:pirin [Paenibacillus sp. LMG 31456]|uniref:Pirin n=1 Tax=Paenibacillus foliorum TaxID=2654974 RepID=A0A972K1J1_9BACL|nr:pirin family protein [Paenibacillus foliorum]NOU92842.1 pirin [Paenibacillus foliorum]